MPKHQIRNRFEVYEPKDIAELQSLFEAAATEIGVAAATDPKSRDRLARIVFRVYPSSSSRALPNVCRLFAIPVIDRYLTHPSAKGRMHR
ncbi:MAG: hypothetical protein R3D44_16880 [Hyphomicrobiaceae bacterium]